jgi:hypothetical protein
MTCTAPVAPAEAGEPDEHPLSCCLPALLNQIPDDERELLRAVDIEGIAQRDLAAAYCPPAERDADAANSSWRDLSLATRPS